MKILQINNVYDRLSTGKIVADLHHEYIKKGHESYVGYARGPIVKEHNVFKYNNELCAKFNKILGFVSGVPYGGNYLSTLMLIYRIKKISPDIIHIHCINDYSINMYFLLSYLKKRRLKVVVTNHAEFFYTGNCGYAYECDRWLTGCGGCNKIMTLFDRTRYCWNLMKKSFTGFDTENIAITSVSPWITSRSSKSPFMKPYSHYTVFNGIDVSKYYYHINTNEVVKKYRINNNSKNVLFVTSSFLAPAKGGKCLLEIAKLMPDVNFYVLGQKDTVNEIPSNIFLLGRIYDREIVACIYSVCDATILLSRAETFSMPVAESLCCGTPVVGFRAGGPETIAISDYSTFVKNGDIIALTEAIRIILNKSFDPAEISKKAIQLYSQEMMSDSYIKIYTSLHRYKHNIQ